MMAPVREDTVMIGENWVKIVPISPSVETCTILKRVRTELTAP